MSQTLPRRSNPGDVVDMRDIPRLAKAILGCEAGGVRNAASSAKPKRVNCLPMRRFPCQGVDRRRRRARRASEVGQTFVDASSSAPSHALSQPRACLHYVHAGRPRLSPSPPDRRDPDRLQPADENRRQSAVDDGLTRLVPVEVRLPLGLGELVLVDVVDVAFAPGQGVEPGRVQVSTVAGAGNFNRGTWVFAILWVPA